LWGYADEDEQVSQDGTSTSSNDNGGVGVAGSNNKNDCVSAGSNATGDASSTTTTAVTTKHNFDSLLQVHNFTKDQITISPFEFKPFHNIELFYKLPDDIMLSYASTSPDVEDEDFCTLVRECCYFLMNVSVDSVFAITSGSNASSSSSLGLSSSRERKALVYNFDSEGWWDKAH